MRSLTTRWFILITALLIVVIIAVQVHWMNKTYKFEKNEFNTSVLKSIRGVYEDIPLLYNSSLMLDSLVEKYSDNGFIFQVHELPPTDSLAYYVSLELEDFKVFTDCRLALYDYQSNKYVFEKYLSTDAIRKHKKKDGPLPLLVKNFSYVHLYFPNRNDYIISQMSNWIVASGLLLISLIGFAFAVYYLYRQKFLFEVQKDFIDNVTHEFSTPLSVIEISADGLKKQEVLSKPEKFNKYVDSIKYQSDYLKKHIANLVSALVVGNYKFVIKKSAVVPNDMIKQMSTQLEPLLVKANGTAELNLESTNFAIQADEENLYLALFNIITNAIKYSDRPKIVIKTSKEESRYYISIKDNGIGMEPSETNNIFRKFYRIQKGDIHATKGLGLGLYFTQKVVKGHKGNIVVKSLPGKGSEFIIDLPVKN